MADISPLNSNNASSPNKESLPQPQGRVGGLFAHIENTGLGKEIAQATPQKSSRYTAVAFKALGLE